MVEKSLDEAGSSSAIEFILKENVRDLSGCTLVTGFYGIGKVGFISVNHMIEKLEAERIGFMLTDFLPPFLSIKNEDLILPFEIYRYENIVFISAFFEPYKNEHRAFSHAIVKWAIEHKMSHSILIGGLDSRLRTDEEVFAKGVYSTGYKEKFNQTPIPIMDEGLFITGPMALVLMYSELEDFPAMGVMPYAERSRPDPIASSHAVEILNDLLGTECGVEELVQEAESIESELQSMEGMLQEEREDAENRDRGMFL